MSQQTRGNDLARLEAELRRERERHEAEVLAVADSVDPHWALSLIGESERHYYMLFQLLRQYRKSHPRAAA